MYCKLFLLSVSGSESRIFRPPAADGTERIPGLNPGAAVLAEQAGGRVGRAAYRAGQLRVGIAGGIRPARLCRLAGSGVRLPLKAGAVLGSVHTAALFLVAGPMVRGAALRADHNIVGFREGLLAHRALAADVIGHRNKPPGWEKYR